MFLHMLSSGPAWLGIVLLVTVSLLPDVLKKVLCRQLWPTATERTQVRSPPRLACASSLYSWEEVLAGEGLGPAQVLPISFVMTHDLKLKSGEIQDDQCMI